MIHAHTRHDFALRVQAIKSLRELLASAELVAFACFAHLAALETAFDASLFDVFLYYALVGVGSSLPLKRVYSLNILNSIAQFNPDSLIGSLDKLQDLVVDRNWEVLAQSLTLASRLLESMALPHDLSHRTKRQPSADPSENRRNIQSLLKIIKDVFNSKAPQALQKVGLFCVGRLLPHYRELYPHYFEMLLSAPAEFRNLVLSRPS